MPQEIRNFCKKLAIFLLPFGVYGAVTFAIDPYNYFSGSSIVGDELKKEISYKLNFAMWKMLEYRQAPVDRILLGDSRMMSLDTDLVAKVCGDKYYNFAYGGGSLKEAIATFKYASDMTELKSVVIGLDLNSYNGSDNKDRVTEVLGAIDNLFLYLTNNNVLLSTTKIITSKITGKTTRIGAPPGDRDTFWQQQLEVTARVYFSNYRDPHAYRSQLAEVADLCNKKGIELIFVIFPSHMDLMEKIDLYGLTEANETMKLDLANWGKVYDFAWENAVTRDRASFKDPYHFNTALEEDIIETVWGHANANVRIYGPTIGGPEVIEPHLQSPENHPTDRYPSDQDGK